jgi:hypothetical protein
MDSGKIEIAEKAVSVADLPSILENALNEEKTGNLGRNASIDNAKLSFCENSRIVIRADQSTDSIIIEKMLLIFKRYGLNNIILVGW